MGLSWPYFNSMEHLPEKIICVMDGQCTLCSFGAKMIARFDRHDDIRIATAQSDLGQRLFVKAGLDPNDPQSWVVYHNQHLRTDADAVLYLSKFLSGPWQLARVLAVVPHRWRNGLYRVVARNRYRWFGRRNMCDLPDKHLQSKLL